MASTMKASPPTLDRAADLGLLEAEVEPGTPLRLLVAGLDCFAQRGFHATTTRDIALRAGMSPTAMYVHYASKGELLYRLSLISHRDALRVVTEATEGFASADVRLWHLVAEFAEWHARHHRLARVAQYELGALPPERTPEIHALRRQVSQRVSEEFDRGIRAGVFQPPEAREAIRAILSLCIDITRWYTPSGPRTPEELGRIYADLAVRMIAALPA
jgi:AcrR family transcriptional regulator